MRVSRKISWVFRRLTLDEQLHLAARTFVAVATMGGEEASKRQSNIFRRP